LRKHLLEVSNVAIDLQDLIHADGAFEAAMKNGADYVFSHLRPHFDILATETGDDTLGHVVPSTYSVMLEAFQTPQPPLGSLSYPHHDICCFYKDPNGRSWLVGTLGIPSERDMAVFHYRVHSVSMLDFAINVCKQHREDGREVTPFEKAVILESISVW